MQELGKWLQKAKFEPGKMERTENFADGGMRAEAKPLPDALGFEVLQLTSSIIKLTKDKERKKYNFLRIHGPNTTRIRKVEIVPIQAWGFDPMLDGEELKAKTITRITKEVDIKVAEGSISDLLIIAN